MKWKDDPGVQQILRLMWPALVAGGAVQINVMLNSIFASNAEDGAVTWLQSAFRLMQLPLGVFGVTVATVTLPSLAREATNGINDKFRELLGSGMRLVFVLTLPCAIGLIVLAKPIISVLFQHGKFNTKDVEMTAGALQYYAIGLVFYSAIKVLQPAFYTIEQRFFPMIVGLISIVINAILNTVFIFGYNMGHYSLALSTALVAGLNFILLYVAMKRHAGHLHDQELAQCLGKLSIAVLLMGGATYAWREFLCSDWDHFNLIHRLGTTSFMVLNAVIVFLFAGWLLKIKEIQSITDIFMKKFARK
jgi:putative peptidoglycan lipid II flippase